MSESSAETQAAKPVQPKPAPKPTPPPQHAAPKPAVAPAPHRTEEGRGASAGQTAAARRAAGPTSAREGGVQVASKKGADVAHAPSDHVQVSHEDDDSDREGDITIHTPDGRRTTRTADGKTIVSYEDDGNQISKTTYERDGAKISETVVQEPDGDTRTVARVEKDGVIDVTRSRTVSVDQDVESFTDPAQVDRLKAEVGTEVAGISDTQKQTLQMSMQRLVGSEERDPTRVTAVEHTVTDTNENPPKTRKISESTTYSQRVPLTDEDRALWEHRLKSDPAASGTTLAIRRETRYDSNGNPTVTEEAGATKRWVGQPDAQGRAPSHTEGTVSRDVNGRPASTVEIDEDRNLLGAVPPHVQGTEYADQLQAQRAPDETLQRRKQSVTTYDADGTPHTETVETLGENIDNLRTDGPRVAIRQVDGKTMWEYTNVSHDGTHIDSQTSIQGTDTRMITRQRPLEGGGFTRTSEIRDGDAPPSFVSREKMERVPAEAVKGSPDYREAFMDASGSGPFYRYTREAVDSEKGTRQQVERFSSPGGPALVHVTSTDSNDVEIGDTACTFKRNEAEVLYTPKGEKTWSMRADDKEFTLDRAGVLSLNGEKVQTIPGIVDEDVGVVQTAASAAFKFRKALQTAGDLDTGAFAQSAKGATATFGLVQDTFGLVASIRDGDPQGVVTHGGGVTSGLGSLSELGSKVAGTSRAATVLSTGGKALGAAGGAISLGVGVYEITQGNVRDGVLDVVIAGGGLAAMTGVGAVPGTIVAGAALTAKLLITGIEGERVPPLEI